MALYMVFPLDDFIVQPSPTLPLLSLDVKPSLKANTLAEMMASFGSCGLPGVLHYCLLPLIKYLVSQLLAAQQRLDHTGSAGQDRGKKVEEKKRSGGRGNELCESSCFGCCFCFPALCSAVSPVFITFNIMVVFTIYFVLVSSSPSLKLATS